VSTLIAFDAVAIASAAAAADTKVLIDHFSGPDIAVGPVCVYVFLCLCVQTITFELDDHLPRYLVGWFILSLSRSLSKVKVIGHGSLSLDESVPFWLRVCYRHSSSRL